MGRLRHDNLAASVDDSTALILCIGFPMVILAGMVMTGLNSLQSTERDPIEISRTSTHNFMYKIIIKQENGTYIPVFC